jgi:cell division protease FtsH
MVTQWGMSSKLGLVAYDSDQPVFLGMEYGHSDNGYSEKTAQTIDEEVRAIIETAHERATKLLKENRSILDNMSRVLVEKETIYTAEVKMLMEGKNYKEVIAAMDGAEERHEKDPFERGIEEVPVEEPVESSDEPTEE